MQGILKFKKSIEKEREGRVWKLFKEDKKKLVNKKK